MNHDDRFHLTPAGTSLADPPSDTAYRLAAIPLPPDRVWTLAERACLWRALRDSPQFAEDGKMRAARRSERTAKRLVSLHHSTSFGHIFSNKRVPRDPTASALGRYELDLLVITPRRIVNMEIKKRSGKLRVQGTIGCNSGAMAANSFTRTCSPTTATSCWPCSAICSTAA